MRAVAKCLSCLILAAVGAHAQDLDIPPFPGHPGHGVGQFNEVLPPTAGEVVPEMVVPTSPRARSEGYPQVGSHDFSATSMAADSSAPYLYEPTPGYAEVLPMGDSIGQPYDLPVSDVISETAETFSTNNWFRGGGWFSRQELVMLLRADLPVAHVAVDLANNTFSTSFDIFQMGTLNSKSADFTAEPGMRLSIGKMLGRDVANRDHGIEFAYLGGFDFSGRGSISASNPAGSLRIDTLLGTAEARSGGTSFGTFLGFPFPNTVPGFSSADQQTISYQADFNSFELNYLIGARPARDRLVMQPDGRWMRFATPSKVRAIVAGLRYIRQNETFLYESIGGPTGVERGLYSVNADNDLFGVQLGSEVAEKRTDWVFGLAGKVGGLINFAARNSSVNGVGDLDLTGPAVTGEFSRSQALSDETLAFMGDATAYLAYYIRPNTSLRLSYSAMYLNGLATSTENLGLHPEFPKFEVTGDSLYHGMHLGFEMTW